MINFKYQKNNKIMMIKAILALCILSMIGVAGALDVDYFSSVYLHNETQVFNISTNLTNSSFNLTITFPSSLNFSYTNSYVSFVPEEVGNYSFCVFVSGLNATNQTVNESFCSNFSVLNNKPVLKFETPKRLIELNSSYLEFPNLGTFASFKNHKIITEVSATLKCENYTDNLSFSTFNGNIYLYRKKVNLSLVRELEKCYVNIYVKDKYNNTANVSEYFRPFKGQYYTVTMIPDENNMTWGSVNWIDIGLRDFMRIQLSRKINTHAYVAVFNSSPVGKVKTVLKKFYMVEPSIDLEKNLKWVEFRFFYDKNATINEKLLKIFTFNESSGTWYAPKNQGVNISKNFIWLNSTHFSFYTVQEAYCGDGQCDSNEDCSSCPEDCGSCPSSSGSSGGGGGSSGYYFFAPKPKPSCKNITIYVNRTIYVERNLTCEELGCPVGECINGVCVNEVEKKIPYVPSIFYIFLIACVFIGSGVGVLICKLRH